MNMWKSRNKKRIDLIERKVENIITCLASSEETNNSRIDTIESIFNSLNSNLFDKEWAVYNNLRLIERRISCLERLNDKNSFELYFVKNKHNEDVEIRYLDKHGKEKTIASLIFEKSKGKYFLKIFSINNFYEKYNEWNKNEKKNDFYYSVLKDNQVLCLTRGQEKNGRYGDMILSINELNIFNFSKLESIRNKRNNYCIILNNGKIKIT